jgi:hypothetical protein
MIGGGVREEINEAPEQKNPGIAAGVLHNVHLRIDRSSGVELTFATR